jgi:hypothetical protein
MEKSLGADCLTDLRREGQIVEINEVLDELSWEKAFQFRSFLQMLLDFVNLRINRCVSGVRSSEQPDTSDELLTAKQAADLFNVSIDWLYRHSDRLPFAIRLSRKSLRFSKKGLLKYRDGLSMFNAQAGTRRRGQ